MSTAKESSAIEADHLTQRKQQIHSLKERLKAYKIKSELIARSFKNNFI